MSLSQWPQARQLLVAIVILALFPVGPVGAQETVASETASESDVTRVEIPERLQRTFDLLRAPGFHPELAELLGLESANKSGLPTSAPAALKTGYWVLIGVGVGLAVVVIIFLATCCSGLGGIRIPL